MGTSADKKDALKRRFKIKHWEIVSVALAFYDMLAVNAAYFFALWLCYDCRLSAVPSEQMSAFLHFAPIYSAICLLVFICLKLYKSIWRFASFSELMRVTVSACVTFVVHTVGMTLFYIKMPMAYYFVGALVQFMLILGIRFSYRFILLQRNILKKKAEKTSKETMIVGAGSAGQMILRDTVKAKEISDHVCCFIDDNPNKWGRSIDGVPVVGGREDILTNIEKYKISKILIAIPSASAEDRRSIVNICAETGCEIKTLPGIFQLTNGEVTVSSMKDVAVEDLLERDPISVELGQVFDFISGKTILVTGGGGSIGSELCRQIAKHSPKQLIIFDIYENNAHAIQMELTDQYPNLNLEVLIGSVRDSQRVNQVFAKYRPDVVYHAAAHKHVPLMEGSPCEAIKNNPIGTYKTAYAAMVYGCQRFVLISTDKAVNPTNIMGASKRLCEMVIQAFDWTVKQNKTELLPRLGIHEMGQVENMTADGPRTEFVAVRFGNVLGSNGSVIPRFKEQIAKGGPVTVTDKEITRYFMTIPEAVSLVLQAGTYANGGEIFVLDMGEPVKIDDLARNMIRLSGYVPDKDIKIEYTGLRPGEKLYEEKLMEEEGMRTTPNHLIHIGNPIPFDIKNFLVQLEKLMEAAYCNRDNIREMVAEIVSTYHPSAETWNVSAKPVNKTFAVSVPDKFAAEPAVTGRLVNAARAKR